MKPTERKQLRVNFPAMVPLLQCTLGEDAPTTYICPFCCCVLGTVRRRLPKDCPECGQKIMEEQHG